MQFRHNCNDRPLSLHHDRPLSLHLQVQELMVSIQASREEFLASIMDDSSDEDLEDFEETNDPLTQEEIDELTRQAMEDPDLAEFHELATEDPPVQEKEEPATEEMEREINELTHQATEDPPVQEKEQPATEDMDPDLLGMLSDRINMTDPNFPGRTPLQSSYTPTACVTVSIF